VTLTPDATVLFRSLAFVVALALPGLAIACECAVPFLGGDEMAPADGARDVPTNTRVWFVWQVDGTVFVVGGGERVMGEVTKLTWRGGEVQVFTPGRELQPRTAYQLGFEDGAQDGVFPMTFVTADGPDREPPTIRALPTGGTLDEDAGSAACGPTRLASFGLEGDGLVVVLDVAGEAALGDDPVGSVSGVFTGDSAYVGSSVCSRNWPDARAGGSTQVRFGAFDLAGNFSGWTAAQEARIPEGGCSASGSAAAWVGVLALVPLRRKGARRGLTAPAAPDTAAR
jgi:hypothetical protein